ncbi:probable serine/threonine-protein kinase PBL3 isoform X2 [Spinacia oleracea]|uniref:Probable serine/threonine-protein kinase PBL3 isoform X2 n=1 Tax=Spinacia oleracea TaxID=3562 RepID=A0ABM3R5H4_SPIOL|nr:probable serine/threonine-protein kinase PBL3 isoform X2 [Spinacia oleracea]
MGNCLGSSAPRSNLSLPTERPEEEILSSPGLKAFSIYELKTAIQYFDSLTEEGGSDLVFKGWIDEQTLSPSTPETGMVVAFKNLKPEGFHGDKEYWLSELNYIGQLHHPNLVKLFGYCLDGQDWFLVYEYLAKGRLENHLFGDHEGIQPLSWETRMKVAIGAAKGLCFLHDVEPQVIYRYLDASNILLDDDFNVKLQAYVSTQVNDIQGYATQGYADTGCVSAMSDVYSYGILLLVLLTGRKPLTKSMIGDQRLLNWVTLFRRKLIQIMDTKLERQYPENAAITIATLALQCTHFNPSFRPKMSEVLEKLQKALTLL